MAFSANEPATKFFGPNRRFQPVPGNNVRVEMQVYNLLPGEFWNPAWEAELLTPRILTPHPTVDVYAYFSTNFVFSLHWRFTRIEFRIRVGTDGAFVFRFTPVFCVHKWCINELKAAAGNYAYAGTGTISWFEI